MGRPNEKSPLRFSPYKRRSPLGIISNKIRDYISSTFGSGLRRSLSKATRNNSNSAHSNLASLPLEILFELFDTASALDLLGISISSRVQHCQVSIYLSSCQFAKRFGLLITTTEKEEGQKLKHVKEFGRLFRMCFLFHSREHLVNFIVQLYTKVNNSLNQQDKNSHFASYWGVLFSKISEDWSQPDFYILMKHFIDATDLVERVDHVLHTEDTQWEEELSLRRLLRGLFIDHRSMDSSSSSTPILAAPSQQLPFRLSALLHLLAPDQLVDTHRLMLILTAPVNVSIAPGQLNDLNNNEISAGQAFVDYQRIYTEPITDLENARAFLGELPSMLSHLLDTRATVEIEELRWSELELFNFLEILTTFPEPWVLRNFAALLIMAPGLTRVAVQTRALHGNPEEAGSTLVSCVEASVLLNYQTPVLLRDTIHGLTTKCSPTICMTVLREAIVCTYQHALETLATDENMNQLVPDIDSLRTSLEMGHQVADLFLSHLHFIFV